MASGSAGTTVWLYVKRSCSSIDANPQFSIIHLTLTGISFANTDIIVAVPIEPP